MGREKMMSKDNGPEMNARTTAPYAPGEDLRDSPMMAHLLSALEAGTDVGHFGRLTFAIVARHFLEEAELVGLLSRQPEMDERKARALVLEVKARDYNPPKRERILEWQAQQEFAICPDAENPSACNIYRELKLPDGIYQNIEEFYEEQVEAQETARSAS